MLRKRLPTPLVKELHLASADQNTGKDFYSPLSDAFHTSAFTSAFRKGRLTGAHSLLQSTQVSGPDSLLDDDVLHLTPNDQGINLSNAAGSLSGVSSNDNALSLRPRRNLHVRSFGARRLRQERQSLPDLSDTSSTLSNTDVVDEVTEMTGLDAVQSTSSGTNLLNRLNLGGAGGGLLGRSTKRGVSAILSDTPPPRCPY